MAYSKGFTDWLEGQLGEPFFIELMKDIQSRADGKAVEALQKGETEYEKGYAAALRFVADLPRQIMESVRQAKTAD